MSEPPFKLPNAPIVEAVVDIDCDLPPEQDLGALEGPAREAFRDSYPKFRNQYFHAQDFKTEQGAPPIFLAARQGLQSLQLLKDDEKQLIQVRAQGYSFNRLAPYGSLDDYLPEIEQTWRLYTELAAPVQVRLLRLRYINRILLPLEESRVELGDYLQIEPFRDMEGLLFNGFLHQHTAVELATGYRIQVVLAAQNVVQHKLPILFDNCVEAPQSEGLEPTNWPGVREQITGLRGLKNRVFRSMLTERCLSLFQ
jgi:uncharacterized protein (TIGR04255 family)